MDGQVVRAVKPFGLRSYLLLVLAVLAGLTAMHGLGPAPAPAAAHAAAASHHAPAAGHDEAIAGDAACQDGCVHAGDPAGSRGGGHAEHADATCAATGTVGAPALPAPAVLPGHAEVEAVLAHGVTPGAGACGRAPPSLSEVQLLRI
ncbi:hypothetical protein HW130_00165 [Streptomyces sp. PKU-EA00015]|uniref:DUF6153 family protein n=1 Tax=Streptomyces sp. PKU-EA00015 TaxID=2748326 RepID=UPI00159FCC5B|nr:DUF6153 family protein [Streptomyces sp. PKU-EA00015]NWF24698.1 hypothetical protein [Streptomyces sp. PKU-EA00015]